ncbi:MAG TPA: aminopeptidase P family protein [Methylomirabilota bacterium]|jgi:Xaa-Pro aminopeptidase|nr:aminopeptidase P family protein [Methylomirabilota bacterium]
MTSATTTKSAVRAADTLETLLEKRRERAASAWALRDEVLLVGAGSAIGVPGGADLTFPFMAHTEYVWLAGHEVAGAVLAFDPRSGWTDFVPPVTQAERVWEGRQDTPGTPLPELAGWLAARRGRPVVSLGVPIAGLEGDAARAATLREQLLHARRPKDAHEIALLRRACDATAAGFKALVQALKPGVSERALQVELELGFLRAGGDRTGYSSIVGIGSNSGVLHFTPSTRQAKPGDVVLVDAGAEVGRYTADVTRTYRLPGGDDGFFRSLHALVLAVERKAIAGCRPGAEWRDLHLAAAHQIAEGLVSLGLLVGAAESLVERDTHALFFPHGLGHMVGLGVRDASGYLPGRARSNRPGLSMLRTDLPLEKGYVMTVEPGIYFIPALLQDPALRERHRDAVRWDRVDALLEFGGIRIEDDVLVTDSEPDVLTAAIP